MSYDFNATYGELKVYDQGQEGACWHYAHGLGVVAAQLMHGMEVGWTDPNAPTFTYSDVWHATISGADHTVSAQQGTVSVRDPATMRDYLNAAGFATLSITQPASLGVWAQNTMPIIRPLPGDSADGAHDVFVAGWTDDGLLIQNSWGLNYALHGRAVLSWEWLAQFGVEMVQESYDGFPLLATKPSQPYSATPTPVAAPHLTLPKEPRMLVRFAGQPDVFEVVGSHLEHITSQAYIARDRPPVTDLPATHPLAALPKTNGAA